MRETQKNKICISRPVAAMVGLGALLIVIVSSILVPYADLFKGQIEPGMELGMQTACSSIKIKTIPSPLKAGMDAVIILETTPADFNGPFTAAVSSGSLSESGGEEGSYITSGGKVLSYSGGEEGSRITVQAEGENNQSCSDTLLIEKNDMTACEAITVTTSPSPLAQNQSAEIIITTQPEDWYGTFLITGDSGKLQLTQADPKAKGDNTDTLVTSLKRVLYNGGGAGETIGIKALGDGNQNCIKTITITE